MRIKALAPWYGGKRRLAPRIVELLGSHTSYWEPFVGGCSILPFKPRCRMETINDLHGDVINLARVIQDDELAPELFARLLRVLPHEDEVLEAQARRVQRGPAGDGLDLDRAIDYFIVSWLGANGESGLRKCDSGEARIAVRWDDGGGGPATRFKNAVDGIPEWWERLRGVTILRRDAFEVIDRIKDDAGTVLYIDSPYVVKSDPYLHDFEEASPLFGQQDGHERLRASLGRFSDARVVVSYYDHPQVRELYRGWKLIECPIAKSSSNQGGAPSTAPEILLVNECD